MTSVTDFESPSRLLTHIKLRSFRLTIANPHHYMYNRVFSPPTTTYDCSINSLNNMTPIIRFFIALLSCASVAVAFVVPKALLSSPDSLLHAIDRRRVLSQSLEIVIGVLGSTTVAPFAWADEASSPQFVAVAGATGQTGRRILERLLVQGVPVVGGVRNVAAATKALSESSTVVRGAMVQNVAAVTAGPGIVPLQHLDVVQDSIDEMAATLTGAKALIIATGFVPGNPLKMNEMAHAVDNVGTCRLIDAAKQAGVTKVVMVSSILTNGRAWGQEKSPGFIVTNAFGNVLDEKLQAEQYLRESGLDYTIVRPGGLKAKPPAGALLVSGEDTLNSGEVSRDLVADVCIAALTDPKASNKVLEIIEDEETPPKVFNGLNM
jgi:uncharacterized protein YbjT (DUF2867 family)